MNRSSLCVPVMAALCGVLSSYGANATNTGSSPQTMPAATLSGTYIAPTAYPRVFMTKAKAQAMLASTNKSVEGMLIRIRLAAIGYTSDVLKYTTPYVGTELLSYQNRFSISAAPAAAALALYVYLYDVSKESSGTYGDPATAEPARSAALAIVNAWGLNSFQDSKGNLLTRYSQYTTNGVADVGTGASVGLQIGRGMNDYVDAVDMLVANSLSTPQARALASFILRQMKMEIGAANYHYSTAGVSYPQTGCGRFDNQATGQLLSIAEMARFTGDITPMNALAGVSGSTLLSWSLPQQIEGTIYGTNDNPRTCSPQSYSKQDINGNPVFYQDTVVAPGEIVDRYRAQPYQMFGYPLGNLLNLELTSDIMAEAGFDVPNFVGNKGQSLKMALDYYGNYHLHYLSYNAVNIPATGTLPNFSQYAGQTFTKPNGESLQGNDALLPPYILGIHIYPNDGKISSILSDTATLANNGGTIPYWAFDVLTQSDWFVPPN